MFAGANMENASYPLSVCAERNAVATAAFQGARRLEAVAVTSSGERIAWPCGGCRQVLHEFGPDMVVIVEGPGGEREQRPLTELLPEAFGPSDLGVRSPSGQERSGSGRATPPDPPDLGVRSPSGQERSGSGRATPPDPPDLGV